MCQSPQSCKSSLHCEGGQLIPKEQNISAATVPNLQVEEHEWNPIQYSACGPLLTIVAGTASISFSA